MEQINKNKFRYGKKIIVIASFFTHQKKKKIMNLKINSLNVNASTSTYIGNSRGFDHV